LTIPLLWNYIDETSQKAASKQEWRIEHGGGIIEAEEAEEAEGSRVFTA
jgi:hypothetical protein